MLLRHTRLLIAEDESAFRSVCVSLLKKHFDAERSKNNEFGNVEIVEVGSFAELQRYRARDFAASIVDYDLMDGFSSAWIRAQIDKSRAPLKILVFTARAQPRHIIELDGLPVNIIHKQDKADLAEALMRTMAGQTLRGSTLVEAKRTIDSDADAFHKKLTRRESEVLVAFGQTSDDATIAATVGCAAATVGEHIKSIRRKLGIANREGLLRAAIELGFASDRRVQHR